MEKRKCKICGQQKTEAEFSKSYRGQCKQCVARKSRDKRASLKAEQGGSIEYINIPGTVLDEQPNWEQRRYDVALTVFLNELNRGEIHQIAARHARDAADSFINELRGRDHE